MMDERQMRVETLIARVERYQQALKLTDVAFAARFARHLGSATTWRKRLCAREWNDIPLSRWEPKLSRFVAEIEGASTIDGFAATMPIARFGAAAYEQLQGQASDRRVAWLIGPTGVGKSWTMRHLAAQNPHDTAFLHINQGAKNSMMLLSRQLANACGATVETSAGMTFENVVDKCSEMPLTLLIDDVHEGGSTLLKLLKHLIDDSRVRFVLGTYPTAWAKLMNGSTDALIEAQQLLGRSLKPVCADWIEGLRRDDVEAYLEIAGCGADSRLAAERLAPILRLNGNLRTLSDAVELARAHADEGGKDLTTELVEIAVRTLCPGRK